MVEKKLKKSEEGLGISGFTLGILSIVLAGWLGAILAIIGFIFCLIQQKGTPTKIGRTGIILNVIGFLVSVIATIISYYLFSQL